MATEAVSPELPEPVEPIETATPESVATPVPEVTPAVAPQPTPTAHDPWLVHQAKQLTIPDEMIAGMTPAELNRSVILLTQQQARLAQQNPLSPQVKAEPIPAPEPEWDLPVETKSKLAEFDPAGVLLGHRLVLFH